MEREIIRMVKKMVLSCVILFGMLIAFLSTSAFAVGSYGVDLASSAYQSDVNPFYASGYGGSSIDGYDGECTWYAWGRAYEKLGVELPCRWHAKNWPDEARDAGYVVGTEARANSIMVEHYPNDEGTGHVFFVESVENGYAYVTEGNWNGYYHEDAINLSTMRRDAWKSHPMGSIEYIYLTDAQESQAPGNNSNAPIDPVLPDGDYIIAAMADNHYYLDIYGLEYPAKAGTKVQLCYSSDGKIGDCDAWTIRYSNGYYRISQYGQSLSLDVEDESTANGANVQVWINNDFSAQKWKITGSSSTGYRLKAQCSNKSLEYEDSILKNGTKIQQWADADVPGQYWVFIPYSNQSHTVTYNANGGKNPPPAQIKKQGETLTLSKATPTRDSVYNGGCTVTFNANEGSVSPSKKTITFQKKFSFKDWNTSADGKGETYRSGSKYEKDKDVTLYAQWYSSLSPSSIMLPTPTREGYRALGWSTSSSAKTAQYQPGASYSTDKNTTLYAVWEPASDNHYLDVNGWLDDKESSSIGQHGTFDVYINGSLKASGINDYYTAWPNGTRYEIKNIIARTSSVYNGVRSGSLSGTIGSSDVNVVLSFSTKPTVSSPSVSFESWNDDRFTYIRETDASIGQRIVVTSGSCTEVGMILYDANGQKLGSAKNPTYEHEKNYFKINEELGVTLKGGTVYQYKFYAIVDGQTMYGSMGSFTTNPSTHSHSYSRTVIHEPTCANSGYAIDECAVCGLRQEVDLPALGHDYADGVCRRCGAVNPGHSHEYSWSITQQPTCTEAGYKTGTCACGDTTTQELPAIEHDFVNGICSRCGAVSSEHSHVFTWTTAKQATCTEKGSETGVCACGNTFVREIAPLGHDYLNGVCTRCGAAEPSSATIRINIAPAPTGPIVGGAGSTISADPALSNINIDLSKLP